MTATTAPGVHVPHPDPLLARLKILPADDPAHRLARTQAIERYLPIARYCARRFTGRGQPMADLTQVAIIGLIKAVDRYDPARDVPFSGFAIPTVLGEIRRHFRDTTWAIQVPRRLQEVVQQIAPTTERLGHELHRAPTAAELAAELGVSRTEVLAARAGANAYRPVSFEHVVDGHQHLRLGDLIGSPDPDLEAVDQRETVRRLLGTLPERERRIVALRFVAGLSQKQIAMDIGLSQMQISRLLAGSLARLRVTMLAESRRTRRPTAPRRGAGPSRS